MVRPRETGDIATFSLRETGNIATLHEAAFIQHHFMRLKETGDISNETRTDCGHSNT